MRNGDGALFSILLFAAFACVLVVRITNNVNNLIDTKVAKVFVGQPCNEAIGICNKVARIDFGHSAGGTVAMVVAGGRWVVLMDNNKVTDVINCGDIMQGKLIVPRATEPTAAEKERR